MTVENEGNTNRNIITIYYCHIETLIYTIYVKQYHILLCLLHKNNYDPTIINFRNRLN